MSFDLAVWFETAAGPSAEKYRQLCEELPAADVVPRAEIAAFHRTLVEEYHALSEGADSPWNGDPVVFEDAVLMTASWDRGHEVLAFVRQLADVHGLACFDPQKNVTHRSGADLTLVLSNGSRVGDPDPDLIERNLRRLSRDRPFLILERPGEQYVQVQLDKNPGWYTVERREGSAEQHYETKTTDLGALIRTFTGFAAGQAGWERRFGWSRLEL